MRLEKTNNPDRFNVVVCEEASPERRDLLGAGWIAKITGADAKFRFKREFVQHQRGDNVWHDLLLNTPYEYRGLYMGGSKYAHDKNGGAKGFFRISTDGDMVRMAEAEVRDWLRAGGSPENCTKGTFRYVIVLADSETWTEIHGCKLVAIPDHYYEKASDLTAHAWDVQQIKEYDLEELLCASLEAMGVTQTHK